MYSPRRVVSTCLVLLLVNVVTPALTQQATSVETELSVQHAFELALSIDPEVQSALKRMDAFKAKRGAASAFTAQPLALEGSYRSDRNYSNQGLREIELGVFAPVWNWNERARTQSLRDTEIELAQLQFESKKLELAGRVRYTLWNTLAANFEVEIAQARSKTAQNLMLDVEKRVKAGDLAQTDFYQASALYEQSRAELVRTQSVLNDISADFEATIGLPVSMLARIQTESTDIPKGLKPLDHTAIKLVQGQLLALQQQSALVETQERANSEVGLAIISDRAAFSSASEKSLVISTRIPLGNSSEYQGRVLQAESELIAAQAALTKTQRQIIAQGRAAESNLDLFAQLRASAQEQSRLATKTFELYKKSFDVGETDLPTLLLAEQKAFEADKLARKSAIEYAAKISAYKQALGLLP